MKASINDYKPISSAVTPFVNNVFSLTNVDAGVVAKPLFNGNIASMMVNLPKLGAANLYGYSYDQLNRIMSMDAFGGLNNSNNTFTALASANYKERITYDANGNIKTYLRNGTTAGGSPQTMDNLTYGYNITSGKLTNNRLSHVDDAVSSGNYTTDIDDQNTDNYGYDEIGNLTKDLAEGINTNGITWSVYGKILSIVKNGNTISYTYDASGHRISKNANSKTTWYVHDASGNVMAIYEKRSDLNSNHVTQSEVHLYGSSRLGIFNLNRDMESPSSGDIVIFERGKKFFEVINHLGNVLVTVSDRKLHVQDPNNTTQTLYYNGDVVGATDYYPGGMLMPGRTYTTQMGYRYGFNGQEISTEINGSSYTAEFWQYDSRIGRRWNIDPVEKPNISPYAVLGNNPILLVDVKGDDWFVNNLGFYIWSDDASVMSHGFTEYAGTSLPSNVSSYKILTYIETETNFGKQNLLYHKYRHSGLMKFLNWLGSKNITNKRYSPHDEMMSEEYVGMVIGYGVFKAAGVAFNVFKAAGGSIWRMSSWTERGFVYEALRGGNLVKNFPVIDKFVKGVATSIKTMDLKAVTYAKEGSRAVYNTLKDYIDKLKDFKGASKGGTKVLEEDIKERVLDVGIPKGATKAQVEQIQEAIKYGKDQGIKVEINVVK